MPTKKVQQTEKSKEKAQTNVTPKAHSHLGRGLGALLGGNPDISVVAPQSPSRIQEKEFEKIKISLIDTNPFQPRTDFNEEALNELVESIKTQGVIQPITVRKIEGGRYQLIAGERRMRACKLAGFDTIIAYVRTADDVQMLEMGLIENLQRQDLNPIEIALSFQRLMNECDLKQEELSNRVAKSRPMIANYLRLLKLATPAQKAICERKITMGHGKILAALDDVDIQTDILNKVIAEELSVRQLESLVKNIKDKEENNNVQKVKITLPAHLKEAQKELTNYYNTKVAIKRNINGKGCITINFQGEQELQQLLERLKK